MISLEESVSTWQFPVNKVIKFGPCWEAPYLRLVTYWQWHYRISWENGGRITKTPTLIAGAPFPFPSFVLFSLPLSLPFLRLSRRLQKHYVYQTLQKTKNELWKTFFKTNNYKPFKIFFMFVHSCAGSFCICCVFIPYVSVLRLYVLLTLLAALSFWIIIHFVPQLL